MPATATSMVTVSSVAGVRDALASARASGARIGLVPTMGALHEGHMTLVERARREADVTAMSIFVNPLQFGPDEDLSLYPRPRENDERMARDAGVDVLFVPETEEMYPRKPVITVTAGALGADFEGRSRPGHFDGVLTVVAKLFNIVHPHFAVFGQKDAQQAALVRTLVRDLDIPVEIMVSPIVREPDGLAMSSRNRYLSAPERRQAIILSRSLKAVAEAFRAGDRDTGSLESIGRLTLALEPEVRADYLAVVDPSTFTRAGAADAGFAAIVAGRVGNTRLIDNMILGADDQD